MAKGILLVEMRAMPGHEEEFDRWANEIHSPEVVAFDGFLSARRFRPLGHDGPLVTIYEMEADDLDAAREAMRVGEKTPPEFLLLDPAPVIRLYELSAGYPD
jgi:hypothetical protein